MRSMRCRPKQASMLRTDDGRLFAAAMRHGLGDRARRSPIVTSTRRSRSAPHSDRVGTSETGPASTDADPDRAGCDHHQAVRAGNETIRSRRRSPVASHRPQRPPAPTLATHREPGDAVRYAAGRGEFIPDREPIHPSDRAPLPVPRRALPAGVRDRSRPVRRSPPGPDHNRRFEFVVTHDRDLVTAAARTLRVFRRRSSECDTR